VQAKVRIKMAKAPVRNSFGKSIGGEGGSEGSKGNSKDIFKILGTVMNSKKTMVGFTLRPPDNRSSVNQDRDLFLLFALLRATLRNCGHVHSSLDSWHWYRDPCIGVTSHKWEFFG
jgi:hypothetical protein